MHKDKPEAKKASTDAKNEGDPSAKRKLKPKLKAKPSKGDSED